MSDAEDVTVEEWKGPPKMETGAPEPVVIRDGETLWVAYRARDPLFPGWEDPTVTDYLDARPGEPFGVLRFEGVATHTLGPPSDERLPEHRLYGRGLEYYAFHRIRTHGKDGRWIVTFHDETLDVSAQSASAGPMLFASSPEEAISKTKAAG